MLDLADKIYNIVFIRHKYVAYVVERSVSVVSSPRFTPARKKIKEEKKNGDKSGRLSRRAYSRGTRRYLNAIVPTVCRIETKKKKTKPKIRILSRRLRPVVGHCISSFSVCFLHRKKKKNQIKIQRVSLSRSSGMYVPETRNASPQRIIIMHSNNAFVTNGF